MKPRTMGYRLKELGKTILIVLLSISAVMLIVQMQFVSLQTLPEWLGGRANLGGVGTTAALNQYAVVRPVAMAATGENGRYGVQHNNAQVDIDFTLTPGLLADALGNAGTPVAINQSAWLTALYRGTPSIYWDFLGEVPLSVLSSSVGGSVAADRLPQSARYVLLATNSDGEAALYFSGSGGDYVCALHQGVDLAGRVNSLVSSLTPNGTIMAGELASEFSVLAPETLVYPNWAPDINSWTATNPISIYDETEVNALLEDMDFHPGTSQIVGTSSVLSVREGANDSMRIYEDGRVTYHAAAPEYSRFPVPSAKEVATIGEMTNAAWSLVDRIFGQRVGQGRTYLVEVEQEGDVTKFTFGYQLGGVAVSLPQEVPCGQIEVVGNAIVDIDLVLRQYHPFDGEGEPLLPLKQAAAALEAIETQGDVDLELAYLDVGGEAILNPTWVAREHGLEGVD